MEDMYKDPSEKRHAPTWLLVVIAILLLFILVLLIWILTNKMGDINLSSNLTVENWFSYLVTLIGVFVTVFVGLQIYNTVEAKRAMEEAQSKFEKLKSKTENDIKKLQEDNRNLIKENNEFQINLLEKYNKLNQSINWDIKEIRKEYWDERNQITEIVEKTKTTQYGISEEMKKIVEKWDEIQTAQHDFSDKMTKYRRALIDAFVFIRENNKNKTLKLYADLLGVSLYEQVEDNKLTNFNLRLKKIIKEINEADKDVIKSMKSVFVRESQSLKYVNIGKNSKLYDEIQKNIYTIISMIGEITNTPKQE